MQIDKNNAMLLDIQYIKANKKQIIGITRPNHLLSFLERYTCNKIIAANKAIKTKILICNNSYLI